MGFLGRMGDGFGSSSRNNVYVALTFGQCRSAANGIDIFRIDLDNLLLLRISSCLRLRNCYDRAWRLHSVICVHVSGVERGAGTQRIHTCTEPNI